MPRGKARKSLELIEASIGILEEIQPATVRAVCYRFFTMGLIDSMLKCETNKVSRQLTDARENGWLPWGWIVDETRGVEAAPTWADPAAFAEDVTRGYRRNKWAAQPVRSEVWSEKGTVRGRLARSSTSTRCVRRDARLRVGDRRAGDRAAQPCQRSARSSPSTSATTTPAGFT